MSQAPSLLNDVLGPVMRGPSSSHTAGSYHIAALAGALLGVRPSRARITFDADGSYGQVYRQQGVDRGFAAGLLGWALTDDRFGSALELAPSEGLDIAFAVGRLEKPDHPNAVDVELWGEGGAATRVRAKSVGGGAVEVTEIDGWPVSLTGRHHAVLLEVRADCEARVRQALSERGIGSRAAMAESRGAVAVAPGGHRDHVPDRRLIVLALSSPLTGATRSLLQAFDGVHRVREAPPVGFAHRGTALFDCAGRMVTLAESRAISLGRLALAYESKVLGLSERVVLDEMTSRLDIMREAVRRGLSEDAPGLRLLTPAAPRIMRAEADGRLAIGGLHTRAAARAMAVMHVNASMGVVCAAPTAGSAGVLPGVMVTLVEERQLTPEDAALALLAAAAVGAIVAMRATFAAEVAGCQVEIGAAGAMAAAAVVDAAGGTARQAADAAAIAFQNTIGSVCDLVQGRVEIPCHTRNAAAAASAFVCADLVLGGYENPIPLDDTIDAVFEVGKMMPAALRCTSKGGLAVTPSALALRPTDREAGSVLPKNTKATGRKGGGLPPSR